MRQAITIRQWQKTPMTIRDRWNRWRLKNLEDIHPTIGTMIAFLGTETVISFVNGKWHVSYGKYTIIDDMDADDQLQHYFAAELCDCLWKAVKGKILAGD